MMDQDKTHEEATAGVLDVVTVLSRLPDADDDGITAALMELGHSRLRAEKLNAFVPSAFGWVVLRRMGMSTFPDHYLARDAAGNEVAVPVGSEHDFTAALMLAFNTLEHGWTEQLPRADFEAVIRRSAEVGVVSQALDAGLSLEAAELRPLRVFRFGAPD